jgi:hypothetical protein
MKFLILLVTLSSLVACKSQQDAKLDRYYEIFKTRNYSDSIYTLFATQIKQHHYDSLKRQEAASWLMSEQQKHDDNIIFNKAFELISVFKVDEQCKYFRKHYFAKRLTRSDDTLQRAMVILVKSLYAQVPENCNTGWGASAVVFLYDSPEDFSEQKSFATASKFKNQPIEVRVN